MGPDTFFLPWFSAADLKIDDRRTHPRGATRTPGRSTRMSSAVVDLEPVQLAHRDKMPGHVFRETLPLEFPFPLLRGRVEVPDLTVQRLRVLRMLIFDGSNGMHSSPLAPIE